MRDICLALYWHMHQPYYYDPLSGASTMPWVRMHATRGYFDLITILQDYPEIRQTFNYVPSLLKQIESYTRGEVRDICLEHSEKPASALTPEEKKSILWNFFMVNWDTMLGPYPRYKELLYKRGASIAESSISGILDRFTERDMRDLQVWFNLAWFGFRACALFPELNDLRRRGSGFSEKEKHRVLQIQSEILTKIIPLHRQAMERGQIELTTTPYYHPIMPLVYDTDLARRAMPDVPLPSRFHHPEDVEAQLAAAVCYHEQIFGVKPHGLWPSEGSVCPEIIPLIAGQGIRWMASDEAVLLRSVPSRDRLSVLYQPYRVEYKEAAVNMVFRDRELSDRIGFSYALNEGKRATADFLLKLSDIAKRAPRDGALVSVILDGENPWQNYPDGGESFLHSLYEELSKGSFVRTIRIGEYLDANPPSEVIGNLHSGSWIDNNYSVWIGEEEDNVAWDLLGNARAALKRRESSAPAKSVRSALEEIYAAEGSDWFWWYGDRFSSDNDEAFDELFRSHLKNVYTLIGEKPPDALDNPIINRGRVSVSDEPKAFLKPAIDGRESSYYEWVDAGRYNEIHSDNTMCKTEAFIKGIMYGFDARTLFLRIDPVKKVEKRPKDDHRIHIHFTSPRQCRVAFLLRAGDGASGKFEISHRDPSGRYGRGETHDTIAIDRIVELSIPFRALGFKQGEEVCFYIQVKAGELELERYPRGGYISFMLPDENFEIEHWTAS